MKVRAAHFAFAVILLFLLSGCSAKEDVPLIDNTATENDFVCEKPNILGDLGCCLDANDNSVCDSEEQTNVPDTWINEAEPVSHEVAVDCRRSLIDGYVACKISWLPKVDIANKGSEELAVSAVFGGWDVSHIKIPQLENRAKNLTALDGEQGWGYTERVKPGASLPILLSVDVFRWAQTLKDELVFMRVCTQATGSLEVNCQNTTHQLLISED